MKKINLLVCTLAVAGLGFTSCSDDDNNSNNDSTRIEGTYYLDEVNTSAQTDFDMDGDAHIDQMEESDCYNGGRIELNADNTFKYIYTDIVVNNGQAGCAEQREFTGVYTSEPAADPSNALITLTYDDAGTTVIREFTKIGNELIWADDNILATYPDRDADGAAVEVSGSREFVYEK